MKFGLFYELQLPKPLDNDQWDPDDEHRIIQETLEQIEFADKLGFDYVFEVRAPLPRGVPHSSAPEVVLAAASQRTKNIRLGHGIVHMPPKQQPPGPRRRAHRDARPRLERPRRVRHRRRRHDHGAGRLRHAARGEEGGLGRGDARVPAA